MPSISGGSPTALLRYTLRTLSLLSNVATLNTSGTSVIAGILYVVGECDSKLPRSSYTSASAVTQPMP